ncbi:MAG: hypothetical protein HY721_32370 [Planctomycetes bacterium]|nr:hypothetical protein [Planctomycetota bacterium]
MLATLGLHLGLCASSLHAPEAPAFRGPEAVAAALEELSRESRGALALETIATTREGRPVVAATLALPGPAPAAARPAVLVTANLEGSQHAATELALEVLRELLRRRDEPEVRAVLERTAVCAVPLPSPDAAARLLRRPLVESSSNARPTDDDRDGRIDEDGPEDLDGDGEILAMRVPDPDGPWVVDAADPRLLRPAAGAPPGAARFRLLEEGTDDDGDGLVNEDPPGGVDISRSFPHEPEPRGPGSGPYPASEPEARGLLELVLARPGLQAAVTYGAHDNLLALPEARDGPPSKRGEHRVAKKDLELYARAAEKHRELTGRKERPRGAPPRGAWHETLYFDFGLPSFAVSLGPGDPPDVPPQTDPSFVPWRPLDHPTLGRVALGGWRPYRRGRISAADAAAMAPAQARLLLWLLGSLARVEIDGLRVEDRGGVYEVRARLVNLGAFPTGIAQGVFTGRRSPLSAEISGGGLRILGEDARKTIDALDGGASRELRWTVLGARGAAAKIEARLRTQVLSTAGFELSTGGSL